MEKSKVENFLFGYLSKGMLIDFNTSDHRETDDYMLKLFTQSKDESIKSLMKRIA